MKKVTRFAIDQVVVQSNRVYEAVKASLEQRHGSATIGTTLPGDWMRCTRLGARMSLRSGKGVGDD